MTTKDESENWLMWSLRDARAKVAQWPDWKKEAMRVLPDSPPESENHGPDAAPPRSDERDP